VWVITMAQVRIHREWFRSVVANVCTCGSNKRSRRNAHKDLIVYAWGEYVIGKWRTVRYVCEECFQSYIVPQLEAHAGVCGCKFELCAKSGHSIPPWITMGISCAA
jgi:hypothetical protein